MKTQVDRDIKGKTSLHDTKFQPVILFTGKKTISQNLNFQTKKFTARQPFPPTPLPPKKKKRETQSKNDPNKACTKNYTNLHSSDPELEVFPYVSKAQHDHALTKWMYNQGKSLEQKKKL